MSVALELVSLRCERGTRVLFSGVAAALEGGSLWRVEGENGAGKTSLLRMICGLALPVDGKVLWRGQDIRREREAFNAALVYIGHAPALKDELSALENLQASSGLNGPPCTPRAGLAALEQAGLGDRPHLPVRLLSQGQRRRAALARLALGGARPLWVLDEPFDALDAHACRWLRDLIAAHVRQGGLAVLTSHQPVDFAGLTQTSLRLGEHVARETAWI